MTNMALLEVSVRADLEAAEAISELLSRYGQGGTVIERPLLPPELEAKPDQQVVTVKAYLDPSDASTRQKLEEALWHLAQIYPFEAPTFKKLAEEDWATAWRQDYHIQHIGHRIVIVPSWLEYAPQSGEVILMIDPGLAFGTGLHPSTRLCLVALEEIPLAGKPLLDLGTGTGILAIYAAKAGAKPIVALDIDAVSVKVAQENAHRNGVVNQVNFGHGSLGVHGYELIEGAIPFPGPFAIIVVNILAETVAALTPAIVAHLSDDGQAIASGIIVEHEGLATAAWAKAGLHLVQRHQEGDWVALIGAKTWR